LYARVINQSESSSDSILTIDCHRKFGIIETTST